MWGFVFYATIFLVCNETVHGHGSGRLQTKHGVYARIEKTTMFSGELTSCFHEYTWCIVL